MQDQMVQALPQLADEENEIVPRKRRRLLARAHLGLYVGGGLLALVLLCMAIPQVLTPGDPMTLDLTSRLLSPGSPGHPLGTDPLGHDVLRLIVYGARPSVLIALVAVLFGCVVGVVLGLVSGYFGGWLEALIMRWTDIQLSFPMILLALVVLSLFGTG